LQDLGEDGRKSQDFVKIGCEDVDWIYLAQDRDRKQALVDTVMNILLP
jgi:hypothetical protein